MRLNPAFGLLLLVLLFGCTSGVAAKNPISLWVVESEHAKVYLLGSIHVMKPDMYPLSATIEKAFNESDVTVFEIDLKESTGAMAGRLMQEKGVYQGSETIYSQLSPEVVALVEGYASENQMDMKQLERLRPWMLNVTIGLLELRKLGFDARYGIDLHYQQRAIASGKPVIPLETLEEQINLLSGDSPEVQALGLKLSLQNLDETPELLNALLTAWSKGDANGMYGASAVDYSDHPELKAQFERLLDHRNEKMAAKLQDLLASKATYFVVIGALHMGGEKGILNLLSTTHSVRQLHHSSN